MSFMDATGSSMMLAPLVAGMRALGRDPRSLLGQGGLSEVALDDPRTRIEGATILALWDEAPRTAEDENFGLIAAMHYAPGMFHVLDYLVSTAPTLGAALERALPRARLLHDLLKIELRIDGALATLVQQPEAPAPLPRAQGDFFMAALVLLVRRLSGVDAAPKRVAFRHRAPADRGPAQALFRCPIEYRAPENSIVFPTALLRVPSREADPQLAPIVAEHAALLMRDIPAESPLVARIKRLLASRLDEAPTRRYAARALGMSERTLQRRLSAAGTTFQDVLTELRIDVAKRLLRDEARSLDEIAVAVGLSGARALARAFRRAVGKVPSELRAEASANGRG